MSNEEAVLGASQKQFSPQGETALPVVRNAKCFLAGSLSPASQEHGLSLERTQAVSVGTMS